MNDANGKPALKLKRTFPFLTLKLFHFPAHAGMTAVLEYRPARQAGRAVRSSARWRICPARQIGRRKLSNYLIHKFHEKIHKTIRRRNCIISAAGDIQCVGPGPNCRNYQQRSECKLMQACFLSHYPPQSGVSSL